MTEREIMAGLIAAMPPTSLAGVWILGILTHSVRQSLTAGRILATFGVLLFDAAVIFTGAMAAFVGFTTYGWLHPSGWAVFYGIAWLVLDALFFLTGYQKGWFNSFVEFMFG